MSHEDIERIHAPIGLDIGARGSGGDRDLHSCRGHGAAARARGGMKFGPTDLDDAVGALLGHSIRHDGGVFKKGRVLSEADIDVLRAADVTTVMAARFEDGDIGEDKAASTLAAAIAGRFGHRNGAVYRACKYFRRTPGHRDNRCRRHQQTQCGP